MALPARSLAPTQCCGWRHCDQPAEQRQSPALCQGVMLKEGPSRDFPGGPVVRTQLWPQVQSLVGELRSCKKKEEPSRLSCLNLSGSEAQREEALYSLSLNFPTCKVEKTKSLPCGSLIRVSDNWGSTPSTQQESNQLGQLLVIDHSALPELFPFYRGPK